MSYEKITTTNKKLDGSTGISEATIDDSDMSFEESSTPTEPITTSSVHIVDTDIALTDEGLTLNDGNTISEIGDGLKVDTGVLKVKAKTNGGISVSSDGLELEAPIWKKIDATLEYNKSEGYYELPLPKYIGTKAIIKYTEHDIEHQIVMILDPINQTTSNFVIYLDGQIAGSKIAAIEVNTSENHGYLNLIIQAESDSIDCVIYYEDCRGPFFTI